MDIAHITARMTELERAIVSWKEEEKLWKETEAQLEKTEQERDEAWKRLEHLGSWRDTQGRVYDLTNPEAEVQSLINKAGKLEAELERLRGLVMPLLQDIASDYGNDARRAQALLVALSPQRCCEHRNFNGCELPKGHEGQHKAGGLMWGDKPTAMCEYGGNHTVAECKCDPHELEQPSATDISCMEVSPEEAERRMEKHRKPLQPTPERSLTDILKALPVIGTLESVGEPGSGRFTAATVKDPKDTTLGEK